MRRGDIVFIKGSSIISKLITKFDKNSDGTDGKFSHVAIAISKKHMIEAEYSSKVSIVNYERLIEKGKIKHLENVDLKITAEERDRLYCTSMSYLGKPYDYLQIISFMLNKLFGLKVFNNRRRFICSELVINAMIDSGLIEDCNHDELLDMTPNELYRFIEKYNSN